MSKARRIRSAQAQYRWTGCIAGWPFGSEAALATAAVSAGGTP